MYGTYISIERLTIKIYSDERKLQRFKIVSLRPSSITAYVNNTQLSIEAEDRERKRE